MMDFGEVMKKGVVFRVEGYYSKESTPPRVVVEDCIVEFFPSNEEPDRKRWHWRGMDLETGEIFDYFALEGVGGPPIRILDEERQRLGDNIRLVYEVLDEIRDNNPEDVNKLKEVALDMAHRLDGLEK